MDTVLNRLADAFYSKPVRLAVFDRELRVRSDLWYLHGRFDAEAILTIFSESDRFVNGTSVILPIHERNSAELTGEYLLYDLAGNPPTIQFFDYSTNAIQEISVAEFGSTYLGWRTRFWHPDVTPPTEPSYLAEAPGDVTHLVIDEPITPDNKLETPTDEFFDELTRSIDQARRLSRETARADYDALSFSTFSETYVGIKRLRPLGRRVDADGQQICVLELKENHEDSGVDALVHADSSSRFEVLVDTVEKDHGFPVEGEVVGINHGRIRLSIDWSTSDNHAAAESAFDPETDTTFRIGVLLNPKPFDDQLEALRTIEQDARKRAILAGERALGFDTGIEVSETPQKLSEYELVAVENAVSASDVFCIHAPPGTRKGRVLTEIITTAVEAGERVLICAASLATIDQLLIGSSTMTTPDRQSLHYTAQESGFSIARVGATSNQVISHHYQDTGVWEARVIGATITHCSQFERDEFDLVVIDNAEQLPIRSSVIPFSCGNRLVLVGDHNLLPFSNPKLTDRDTDLGLSLFEHLLAVYGEQVSTILRHQYQMNEELGDLVNTLFYDSKLIHGQRNKRWTVRDLPPLIGINVHGQETTTPTGSVYNEVEARMVVREVYYLLYRGVAPNEIGIITPVSGQVGKLVQLLDEPSVREDVIIGPVESFGRDSRDVIIVSFVRNDPRNAGNGSVFSYDLSRWVNTAVTRAKKRCVLVGNWDILRKWAAADQSADSETPLFGLIYQYLDGNNLLKTPELPNE